MIYHLICNFRNHIAVLIIAVLITQSPVWAQSDQTSLLKIDPNLDEKENAYLNRQANFFLDRIEQVLLHYPPQYPEPSERNLALFLLDAVLHDVYAAYRPPVQRFFHSRMESVIQQIESTQVDEGAMIWKLYNMGFIVRTKTVTFAFDLVRGSSSRVEGFGLPDNIMKRFADQCDALFISHRHQDHIDEWVAQNFIDNGKPVIAPPQVWSDKPIHQSITHLKREAHTLQTLQIQNGKRELKVVVYPGHQMGNTQNNVSLVFTPEDLSFCQMGDQINEGDFMVDYEWIDKVANNYHVDVLMPPCWTNEIFRIVKGFNPALILPGHENELGHSIDDRVPFWADSEYLELTYSELKRSDYPVIVMTWGESFHFKTPKN